MAPDDRDAIRLLDEIRRLELELDQRRANLAVAASEDLDCGSLQVLEAGCSGQLLLIPVVALCEVVAMPMPEPLPDGPEAVLGTVHYGEQAVPIFDIDLKLGGDGLGVKVGHYLAILNEPSWVGLVVDHIGAVHDIPVDRLSGEGMVVPYAGFVLAEVKLGESVAHLVSPRTLCSQVEAADVR